MDAVGIERLLYSDTDNIYIRRQGESPLLPIGYYLRQLKNVHLHRTWPKTSVPSARDKIYDLIKIRSITLNQRSCEKIRFEHMYNLDIGKYD